MSPFAESTMPRRLLFADHLRMALTLLVVLHHLVLNHSGPVLRLEM
jgi:hypothetical protein